MKTKALVIVLLLVSFVTNANAQGNWKGNIYLFEDFSESYNLVEVIFYADRYYITIEGGPLDDDFSNSLIDEFELTEKPYKFKYEYTVTEDWTEYKSFLSLLNKKGDAVTHKNPERAISFSLIFAGKPIFQKIEGSSCAREIKCAKILYEQGEAALKKYLNSELSHLRKGGDKTTKPAATPKKTTTPSTTTPKKTTATSETAQIKSLTIDHNVYEGGKKGMNIKVSFAVQGMKGKTGRVNVYFYYKDGTRLKDCNNKYCTIDDNVATWEDFTPGWDNTTYTDFKIFMPYEEMHMPSGKFDLKLFASVRNKTKNSKELADSDWYYFTYTK